MRIAAVADLHIGAGPDLHPGRLEHQARMWRGICEDMAGQGVGRVLIAGDVFHRRKPTPGEYLVFLGGLEVLREHGIPVVVIDGNHDVASMNDPSAVSPVARGLRHVRYPDVLDLDEVEVACLPWTSAAALRAEGDLDPALVDKPVAALLVDAARGLRAVCRRASPSPILVLHWSMSGARTPTGARVDEFREPVLPVGELRDMQWGAVIAGHIHNPMVLSEPNIMYCGSPWVVDYGEADVKHGWWLLDSRAGWAELDRRYVPNPLEHSFLTHDLDLIESDGYPQLSRDWSVRDAVVRVRIRCTAAQAAELDVAAMRRSLVEDHGALHVYQVQVNVERRERRRAVVEVEQLSVDDALQLWLGRENDRDPLSVDVWPKHHRFMEEAKP